MPGGRSINPNTACFAIEGAADRIGAAAVLPALSPLLLLVALAIRIESRRPALSSQARVGYRDGSFTVFKVRTMRADIAEVDEALEKLHYDFHHIETFSPWLDIVITLGTVKIILTGFGAK